MIFIVLSVGLAVWATTYILRYLDGPSDVLEKLRSKVNIYSVPVLDEKGQITDYIEEIQLQGTNKDILTMLVACFWCLSVWVAFIFTFIYSIIYWDWKPFLFVWLGSVGVSGVLHKVTDG